MKSPMNPGAPSEVVKAFFDHLMAGKPDLALQSADDEKTHDMIPSVLKSRTRP